MPCIDRSESSLTQDLGKTAARIATVVPNCEVDFTEDRGTRWYFQNQSAARHECAKNGLQNRAIIFDVLNHLQGDGGFELIRPPSGRGIRNFDRHISVGGGRVFSESNKRFVDIDGGYVIGQRR